MKPREEELDRLAKELADKLASMRWPPPMPEQVEGLIYGYLERAARLVDGPLEVSDYAEATIRDWLTWRLPVYLRDRVGHFAEALREPGSVLRLTFELGREWERERAARFNATARPVYFEGPLPRRPREA